MYRLTKSIWFLTSFGWATAAYAQSQVAPGFGSELANITNQVWGIVGLFCLFGILVRVLVELQDGRIRTRAPDRIVDLAVIAGVGLLSGFIMFAICESASTAMYRLSGVRILDVLICGAISASAFSKRRILDSFSSRLKRNIDSGHTLDGKP